MKQFVAAAVLMSSIAVGCHGQVPPNPTSFSCPSTSGSAYVALGAASPNLTQTDQPGVGTFCYIGQATSSASTPPLVSVPSTPTAPQTVTANNPTVTLTITPPTQGVTPTGYVISRAPATAVSILAPAVTPTVGVAQIEPPADPGFVGVRIVEGRTQIYKDGNWVPMVAGGAPPTLAASVR